MHAIENSHFSDNSEMLGNYHASVLKHNTTTCMVSVDPIGVRELVKLMTFKVLTF